MELRAKKLLYDVDQAIELIVEFTREQQFEDYTKDLELHSAMEQTCRQTNQTSSAI